MKNTDHTRMLSKGKSFEYSTWQRFTKYTNDCFKQDFVSYNNVLLACKETHVAEEPPILKYNDEGYPIDVLSKEWHYVFSASAFVTGLRVEIDDSLSIESYNPVQNKIITEKFEELVSGLNTLNSQKVDIVNGKQLSTEDFTSEFKNKLEDLDIIVIDSELLLDSENPVQNKVISSRINDFNSRIENIEISLDRILNPTINPVFINPSASITLVNYNNIVEIGTKGPDISNFKTTYNAGSINIDGVKQDDRAGSLNKDSSFIYVNDSSNKKLPSTIALGNTIFKYRAVYNNGPQPKDNKGNDYGNPLPAGHVDSSNSVIINGTFPWFASTKEANINKPVVPQTLVAWGETMNTGKFTLQPSGDLPQVFKLPKEIKKLEMKNAVGEMEEIDLSKYSLSTEKIYINNNERTYYVYEYNGSVRGAVTLNAIF